MRLRNKVAIVTGSSSGIGEAVALALAKNGAKVIVNSRRNISGGETVVKEIKKIGGDATYIQADVSDGKQVKRLFSEALKKYKTVDILINNAGESKSGKLGDLENWNYQFNNILLSSVISSDEFLQIKSANLRKIVNISSIYGSTLGSNTSYLAYGAMKAGMNNLTVNLAKLHGSKVLVNAVVPGYTLTPPWGTNDVFSDTGVNKNTKIKRFVYPEEIAEMVVSILKNDAMTGQIITVDGGATLKAKD